MGAQYQPLKHQLGTSGIFTGQYDLDKTPGVDETGGELSYSQSAFGGGTNYTLANNESQINKRVSQGSY